LSSPVNGQVGEEQTALARSANSLAGGLCLGFGRTADPLGCARDDKQERATFDKDWLLNRITRPLSPNKDFTQTSPEGTGQSVARHGSAGKDFQQIESRRDDTMGNSHANSARADSEVRFISFGRETVCLRSL
jgi:hypothetical protein